MTAGNGPDFHLTPNGWAAADVLAGRPDGFVDELLKGQGWEEFLCIGDPNGDLYMESWRRHYEDKPTEYLLQVGNVNESGPFMVVDNFPELMDLFTRWAPAVQAAATAGVVRDLTNSDLSAYGFVEIIAARAAHGAGPGREELITTQRNRDAARRAEMAKARTAKTTAESGDWPPSGPASPAPGAIS
ncbi:hypothetical protein [Microtetraspora malaysiensis]|uniref:hypothetical protein n=1 Tax=Microtetraspora malaysiensis TaxID=161358 RepID=UPI003D8CB126